MDTSLLRDLGSPDQATRAAAKKNAARLTNAEFVALCNASGNVTAVRSPKEFAVGIVIGVVAGAGVYWIGDQLAPGGDARVLLVAILAAGLIVGANTIRMMFSTSATSDVKARTIASLCEVVDAISASDRLTAVVRPVYDANEYAQPISDPLTRSRLRALARILPLLTHYQLSTLNRVHRTAITQPLYNPLDCPEATLAAIEAIAELGDKHLIPPVEKLARDPAATPNMVTIRDAAQACLDRVNRVQKTGKDDTVLLPRSEPREPKSDDTSATDDQDRPEPKTKFLTPKSLP